MVTSHDVARLAGVSQPTVSRALRNSTKVSEDTRYRVLQAARALGYVPSETGRALSSGRTRRIGLLLTDLTNQFYTHVIADMHDELETRGYQLMLQTETTDTATVAERLIANTVDGVLLATVTLNSLIPVRLRDRGVPFVYFNRISDAVDADSATVDPVSGLDAAAAAILTHGHRRVGAILGPSNTSTGAQREVALRRGLEAGGVTIASAYTYRGPFDFDTGDAGTKYLLTRDPRPTVIVCSNDVVALGALNAARDLGVKVPQDVSVVGFDNLPPAQWSLIQLTTVAFDLDGMARRAANLLVDRIENGPGTPFAHAVFPSRLIERATLSVAPPLS
ncbi:LacI family DNA-binding transcriptional regulator [uncultured Friedmanniella sp.]|uniref:LacI family DNA-binding transcriptional regulator n=1 Tax=uncultured Friedmanniella sp. TaxID=335381 RepID=UPI0035CAFCD0